MNALELQGITKSYNDRTVVDGVSFDVAAGEIFGLVGPNGSGKTTTIRVALDIVRPDSGAVRLFGLPQSRASLNRVGYLPEERGLYQRSRVIETLRYLGRLKRLSGSEARERAIGMLKRVGLSEHGNQKVQALSRGMAQLVQFSGALLHDPDLIILDEPFSGLDPLNVQLMKEIIREHRQRGAAIIFSTHQMTDVEELCERVALVNDGKLLLYGRLIDLQRERGTRTVRVKAGRAPATQAGMEPLPLPGGIFEYRLPGDIGPNSVLRAYVDQEITIERFEVALPNLNEIFIEEVSRARDRR